MLLRVFRMWFSVYRPVYIISKTPTLNIPKPQQIVNFTPFLFEGLNDASMKQCLFFDPPPPPMLAGSFSEIREKNGKMDTYTHARDIL